MRRYFTGDPRVDAYLLKSEEGLAEARAIAARRALHRSSPPRRGKMRLWLGAVLLAVAHRLLGSVPSSAASCVD
jgi:hypothetical protein